MRTHTLVTAWLLCAVAASAFAKGPTPEQIDAIIAKVGPFVEQMNGDCSWSDDRYVSELQFQLVHGGVSDEQWQRLLATASILRMPERWPVNTPLVVRADVPDWIGPSGSVTMRARCPGAQEIVLLTERGRDVVDAQRVGLYQWQQTIGVIPPGEQDLVFDVEISMRATPTKGHPHSGLAYSKRVVRKGTITKRINIVSADTMKPLDFPELERAVRESIDVYVNRGTGTYSGASIGRNLSPQGLEFSRHLAMNLAIEIINERGEIVNQQTQSLNDNRDVNYLPIDLERLPRFAVPSIEETAAWSIRVRGDVNSAIMDGRWNRYWNGDFTIPFNERIVNEQAE